MSDLSYGVNAVVYGPPKVGKSWLADTAPAPRLVLDAEGGSRFTRSRKKLWDPTTERPPEPDGTWATAFVAVRDFATVDRAFQWLNSGQHPFNSVTIDSVSDVQQRAIDDIAGRKQMDQQGWGTLLRTVSEMVRQFRDLMTHPTRPLQAVIFIAMERVDPDGSNPRPYMQGQISTTLPYYVDLCARLVEYVDEAGNSTRRLYTSRIPGWVTGERLGGCLGPYVDDANFTELYQRVQEFVGAGNGEIAPADEASQLPPEPADAPPAG